MKKKKNKEEEEEEAFKYGIRPRDIRSHSIKTQQRRSTKIFLNQKTKVDRLFRNNDLSSL